jgi:hypothetical protein
MSVHPQSAVAVDGTTPGNAGSWRHHLHRERQEADVIAAPAGMLDRRALVAASGAPRAAP